VRIRFLFCTFFAFTLMSTTAFACKCVSPPPEVKTVRDLAQWYANRSDAIFEGTVQRVELKWVLMDAKVGGFVPADFDEDEPRLYVTFDVSHFYKGVERKDVLLTTGVGGGDCGFDFEIGKKYLIYALADASGHLSTDICSGTGLLEESQSDLSYLRGEKAVSETTKQSANIPATKLCGHVASARMDLAGSQVFLFRVGNKSPIPTEEAAVGQDGSFCIVEAKPDNYNMAFMNRDEDSPTSFVFFPGTTNSSEAITVELKRGQARSDLAFNVPVQSTYSVNGDVLIHNKSALPANCEVFLLSVDPLSVLVSYSKNVETNGHFNFPRVLVGKYWAFVGINDSDTAPNWLTRKTEVDVKAAVSGLSLELIQK
jgi:hypothetical protein